MIDLADCPYHHEVSITQPFHDSHYNYYKNLRTRSHLESFLNELEKMQDDGRESVDLDEVVDQIQWAIDLL